MLKDFLTVFMLLLLSCSSSLYMSLNDPVGFSDVLPLQFIAIVLINFIFGLFGSLKYGFYFSLLLAVLFLLLFVYKIIFQKNNKRNYFSANTFFLYILMGFALCFFSYGKLMASWDEFSHWGDVVKMMTTLDVLSTDPSSGSLFPEYPPAMALFQYFSEEIYLLITGKKEMAEWLLYFSYQLFMFSLYFPLIKKLDMKKFGSYLYLAVLFLLPTVFQHEVYSKIYIDPFLSSAFAVVLSLIILEREHNSIYYFKVFAYLALLTITKTLGILLAVIALVVFLIYEPSKKIDCFKIGAFFAVLLPTASWQLSVKLNSATAAFQLSGFNSVTSEYKSEVLHRYFNLLLSNSYTSAEAVFPRISFLFLFLLVVLFMLTALFAQGSIWPENKKRNIGFFFIMALLDVLFVVGLGFAYVYLFSASEAETMTEASRYINNLLMAQSLIVVFCFIDIAQDKPRGYTFCPMIILAAVMLFTPLQSTARFVTRREVLYSQNFRKPYIDVADRIKNQISKDDWSSEKVVIATESTDIITSLIFRTELRPIEVIVCYLPNDSEQFQKLVDSGQYYVDYY